MNIKTLLFTTSITTVFWISCTQKTDVPASIFNGSFEDGKNGWKGLGKANASITDDEYYAPVDGDHFVVLAGDEQWVQQQSKVAIESGKSYRYRVWVRSVNEKGIGARTKAQIAFLVNNEVIVTDSLNVNAPQLMGVAATLQNDDGANVWIDGNYRHQFADHHMYQSIESDPIQDPWLLVPDSDYSRKDLGWAVGNVVVNDNRFIYGTIYRDIPGEFYSSITLITAKGIGNPDYQWTDPVVILDHDKTEFPWVLDAHLYYDEPEDRLWMTWGGGICYVTEMDPMTGLFLENPEDTEYDTHPQDMHMPVATWPETDEDWCGDEWSSCWMEGASIYKYQDKWYFFGSYGNLSENYTIRMGRGDSPRGPFYDKKGVNMMEFDPVRKVYGNSMLLGDEGIQRVPGHPHVWEENGKYYMGYDYRRSTGAGEPGDYMGIRRIYWYEGWPTVWIPFEVTLKADDFPKLKGKQLEIAFRNTGEADSKLAVDAITLSIK
jgi:hypothetical protein